MTIVCVVPASGRSGRNAQPVPAREVYALASVLLAHEYDLRYSRMDSLNRHLRRPGLCFVGPPRRPLHLHIGLPQPRQSASHSHSHPLLSYHTAFLLYTKPAEPTLSSISPPQLFRSLQQSQLPPRSNHTHPTIHHGRVGLISIAMFTIPLPTTFRLLPTPRLFYPSPTFRPQTGLVFVHKPSVPLLKPPLFITTPATRPILWIYPGTQVASSHGSFQAATSTRGIQACNIHTLHTST
ncbi:hypothetical protein BD779DRAFT_269684 [Infundibulicybe gibba]|nr:hypothetical protein BD779DRAFT_269684 [Infundibulicybe gibba]